jgi:hypothetical protein
MPVWSRWPLRLPYVPVVEGSVVRLAGSGIVRTIRWAMAAPPADAADTDAIDPIEPVNDQPITLEPAGR